MLISTCVMESPLKTYYEATDYTFSFHDICDYPFLRTVIIGKNVQDMDDCAFNNAHCLDYIYVESDSQRYCSVDGVLYSKDMKTLFRYPPSKEGTTFVVPDTVEIINCNAFQNNISLQEVKIPASVSIIGAGAFRLSVIEKVEVDEKNMSYCVCDGVLFSKDKKALVFHPYSKEDKTYVVPEEVEHIYPFALDGIYLPKEGEVNKLC